MVSIDYDSNPTFANTFSDKDNVNRKSTLLLVAFETVARDCQVVVHLAIKRMTLLRRYALKCDNVTSVEFQNKIQNSNSFLFEASVLLIASDINSHVSYKNTVDHCLRHLKLLSVNARKQSFPFDIQYLTHWFPEDVAVIFKVYLSN